MSETYMKQFLRISETFGPITVPGTGLTTIATIIVAGRSLLAFHVTTATQAIDDLNVYARAHPSGQYVDITPTSATWATPTTPSWRIKNSAVSTTSSGAYVDGDLNTIATTENGYLEVDVTGLYDVVIKVSAGADSAAVSGAWAVV